MNALTARHRMVLEFERLRWKYQGAKEAEILARFGMSPTAYYQVLNHAIDLPEAEAYDAPLVRRLRSLRGRRVAARHSR